MLLNISLILHCSIGKPSDFSPFLMITKAPESFTETQNTEAKRGCLGLHHMSLVNFLPIEVLVADIITKACLSQSDNSLPLPQTYMAKTYRCFGGHCTD